MTTLSAAQKTGPRKPARILVLPPAAFADDWHAKPTTPVAVGLRFLCEADLQTARAEAARFALGCFRGDDGECIDQDAQLDTYNDTLMRLAVARMTTDPNDASRVYFPAAEDTVRVALTPEGVRRIWDEYVMMSRSSGVDLAPATDADAARLGRLLRAGRLSQLPAGVQAETRKLLMHILHSFGEGDAPEDVEEDDGIYRVTAATDDAPAAS